MMRAYGITLAAVLLSAAAASSSAAQVSPLPWKPVPLQVGTVTPPANPADWYSSGAWIDENTIAAGIKSNASVEIRSLDGAVQQVLLNPDAPTGVTYEFGCAVHYVDGTLMVMAARFQGANSPVLHVFQRPDPKRGFQPVARVQLSGTVTGTASRMRIWSESVSGGLAARQLVVAWPSSNVGHIAVLKPIGPLEWMTEYFTIPGQSISGPLVGSIRGDTMAMLYAPSWEVVQIWQRNTLGAWAFTGSWYITNAPYDNEFSYPVVMDSDNVLVGQPSHLSSSGRLVHLKFVDGAWVAAGSIYSDDPVPFGRWADAVGAFDDTLVISRKDNVSGLALLQVRRWNKDGSIGPGADLVDANGLSHAFQDDLAKITLTSGGDIIAESEGPPFGGSIQWQPWNYVRLVHGLDLDEDGELDGEAIAAGHTADCNGNWVPDSADIALGLEQDGTRDGVPDACQSDCNGDGTSDFQEIVSEGADCNHNYVPDACELAAGAPDADGNGLPDNCGDDCDRNGPSDAAELAMGLIPDCDGNGIADTCDRYQPIALGAQYTPQSWTAVIWFPVEPGREIIDAVDFETGPTLLSPVVAVVRDRSGVGNGQIVQDSDVLLVEVPFNLTQFPAPAGLTGTIQRCAFRPIDLSDVPAYWLVVSNVRCRSIAPQTNLIPGGCRMRSYSYPAVAFNMRLAVQGFASTVTTASAVWPVPALCHDSADFNRDGLVDGADLGMLIGGWNSAASVLDLDGNGIVAGGDLGMLLQAWGAGAG